MIALIGLACFVMAMVIGAQDVMDFDPDPALQSAVWAGFGVWCLAAAYMESRRRGRR